MEGSSYQLLSVTNDNSETRGAWWRRRIQLSMMLFGAILAALAGVIVALVVVATSPKTNGNAPAPQPHTYPAGARRFLHFSDAHLDIFYNETISTETFCRYTPPTATLANYVARYGRVGCDAPLALVQSQLMEMERRASDANAEFVIFSGDSAAHRLTNGVSPEIGADRVFACMATFAEHLELAFPTTAVFPCFGNDDSPVNYVMPNVTSPWLADVLRLWTPLILKSPFVLINQTVLNETFLAGGYYSLTWNADPATPLHIIVLNTNFFSVSTSTTAENIQRADVQMEWFISELGRAHEKGWPAVIVGHIPPIVDPYHQQNTPFNALWQANFEDRYLDALDTYREVIYGQFFGHLHRDDFKLVHASGTPTTAPTTLPIFLSPAISPVYNTNPGFRVMVSSHNWTMLDYSQFFSATIQSAAHQLVDWNSDYTFSSRYGCEIGRSGACVISINDRLIEDASRTIWWLYWNSRQVHLISDPGSCYAFYCLMRYSVLADVEQCAATYPFQYN